MILPNGSLGEAKLSRLYSGPKVRNGSKSGPDGSGTPLLVYPQDRTSPIASAMSVSCQFQTHAASKNESLEDILKWKNLKD